MAGIVIGVAGATTARGPIFTAGLAGLVAGAVSMALGEYVSVSSQRDSERAQIKQEKRELADTPDAELTELTALYEAKGLSAATARTVAAELTARGALAAHLDAELHIDPDDIASPVQAAGASALSFIVRRAAADAGHPAASGRPAGPGDVRRRPGRSRPDRCPQRPPRAAATSAAPCCAWSSAERSAWPSPTASGTCSAPPSAEGADLRAFLDGEAGERSRALRSCHGGADERRS